MAVQHQRMTLRCVLKSAYCQSGYAGIKQTLYIIRQIDPSVPKAGICVVVRECKSTSFLDLAIIILSINYFSHVEQRER